MSAEPSAHNAAGFEDATHHCVLVCADAFQKLRHDWVTVRFASHDFEWLAGGTGADWKGFPVHLLECAAALVRKPSFI